MTDCAGTMQAIAEALGPEPGPGLPAAAQAHLTGCAACRAAWADARACAALGRAGAGAVGAGLRDPVAWERGLFLRLLAGEIDARADPRDGAWPGAWAGRDAVWGEWSRWKRGGQTAVSRS